MSGVDIKLGDKVKDTVSGFEGIVVTILQYLNGCTQYSVQGKAKKSHDMAACYNIDIQQLKKIPGGLNKVVKKRASGGPMTRVERSAV